MNDRDIEDTREPEDFEEYLHHGSQEKESEYDTLEEKALDKKTMPSPQLVIRQLQEEIDKLRKLQWISVKERLPEKGQLVLACANEYSTECVLFDGENWHDDIGAVRGDFYEYWMPLPKPPTEKGI
jgi:hypothetical protein